MRKLALLPALAVLATLAGPTAHAGLQLPPLGPLPTPAASPRLWFNGADPAAVEALKVRITAAATAPHYTAFKSFVDTRLASIANGSANDDTRSKLAKAAALLHWLGKLPPTTSPFTSYRDAARMALAGISKRNAVDSLGEFFNPPSDAIDILQDSSRLQSMAEAYDLLRGTGLTTGQDTALRAVIAGWADALRTDWNLTGAIGIDGHRDNWGIKGGAALVTAALALPDHANATAWRDAGMLFLNGSLDLVASTTGWFREGAWYLNYSLANLVPAAYHAAAVGVDWFTALRPFVTTALAMRQPDGRAPPFEEGLPNVFPFDVLAARYPDLTSVMKWAWDTSPKDPGNFDNQHIHSVTRFLTLDLTGVAAAPATSPTRTVGADAFIATLATGHDVLATSVTTFAARDTNASILFASRHNMQNPLDLVLHGQNRLLLPTSGGGPTVTTSQNRATYLEPRSKNLPLVDKTAPFIIDTASVTFGDRLDSADTALRPNTFADLVRTDVSAYSGVTVVRRAVALIDLGYVAVFDFFRNAANTNRRFDLAWRGRGTRADLGSSSEQASVQWLYGGARLRLDAASSANLIVEQNATLYADAWAQEESIQGVFLGATAREAAFVSVFQPLSANGAARGVVSLDAPGAAAVEVIDGATVDTLVSAPGDGLVTAGLLTTDGVATAVRQTAGELTALAVIAARQLTLEEAPRLTASAPVTLGLTLDGDGFVLEVSPDRGPGATLALANLGLDPDETYEARLDGVPLDATRFSEAAGTFTFTDLPAGTLEIGPAPCLAGAGDDPDADRYCGAGDNCPHTPNPTQTDTDGDGLGDACECLDAATRCDDHNACTADACTATTGACTHPAVPNGTACDDQNTCTTGDRCQAGACVGAGPSCNDGDPCTLDGCTSAGLCTHTAVPVGTSCTDGNACTVNDRCDAAGKCKGVADTCASLTLGPCQRASCNSITGCFALARPVGTACNDGSACTTGDACAAGALCLGTPVTCDDQDPCTADACDPTVGCRHAPYGADVSCDDGDACTADDHCGEGGCAGAPVVCDDGNPCTIDACVPGVGCASTPAPDGAACQDGDPCTGGDQCLAGACAGAAVVCDDANACTADACVPGVGCRAEPLPGTPACNDGDACTTGDRCQAGACAGSARVCDDSLVCTDDACDPASGCAFTPRAAGASCDDGDACTVSDACLGTACAGDARDCDDQDPCTLDACDPATGCTHAPASAGTACDDGDACTTSDACAAGQCVGGAAPDCDDQNACTLDACDPAVGCGHAPREDGAPCDDGSPCTSADACAEGLCRGVGLDCDDGDPCTIDSCSLESGCAYAPAAVGAACDDRDPCTSDDACDVLGACVGAARDCDDGDPCTADACGADGACENAVRADGEACDDGDPCTDADACLGGACVGAARDCDDGDPCTTDACGADGACASAPLACPDGTVCEAGSCVTPRCRPCGDGAACGEGEVCLETTAGPRCLALCDSDGACAVEGEQCALAASGERVCLAPSGECAELPPVGGEDEAVVEPGEDVGPADEGDAEVAEPDEDAAGPDDAITLPDGARLDLGGSDPQQLGGGSGGGCSDCAGGGAGAPALLALIVLALLAARRRSRLRQHG